jgi:hypothetical protein
MTKVLIDREVRLRSAAIEIRDCMHAIRHQAGALNINRHVLESVVDSLRLIADALDVEVEVMATTAMPTYNASDVCAPCWTRNHEQPLGLGEPPCECPCHGLATRSITSGALDQAGRQEP